MSPFTRSSELQSRDPLPGTTPIHETPTVSPSTDETDSTAETTATVAINVGNTDINNNSQSTVTPTASATTTVLPLASLYEKIYDLTQAISVASTDEQRKELNDQQVLLLEQIHTFLDMNSTVNRTVNKLKSNVIKPTSSPSVSQSTPQIPTKNTIKKWFVQIFTFDYWIDSIYDTSQDVYAHLLNEKSRIYQCFRPQHSSHTLRAILYKYSCIISNFVLIFGIISMKHPLILILIIIFMILFINILTLLHITYGILTLIRFIFTIIGWILYIFGYILFWLIFYIG